MCTVFKCRYMPYYTTKRKDNRLNGFAICCHLQYIIGCVAMLWTSISFQRANSFWKRQKWLILAADSFQRLQYPSSLLSANARWHIRQQYTSEIGGKWGSHYTRGLQNPGDRRKKSMTTFVTIPYVKSLLEALIRVFHHHRVATTMRCHRTFKRMLRHPIIKGQMDASREHRGSVPDTLQRLSQSLCRQDWEKVWCQGERSQEGCGLDHTEKIQQIQKERLNAFLGTHWSCHTDTPSVKEAMWATHGIKETITIRKPGAHSMNWDGGVPPISRSILQAVAAWCTF